MSYQDVVEIQASSGLRQRISACAAMEGMDNPPYWASERMWKFASQPEWAEAWAVGRLTHEATGLGDLDLGTREDVVSDAMILAAVQSMTPPESPAQ